MRIIACCLLLACEQGPAPPAPSPVHVIDAAGHADECVQGSAFVPGISEIIVYCDHVADRCCIGGGQWGCNNAQYVDWYAKYCHADVL